MLETYIHQSWQTLRRNALEVALDPKVNSGMRSFLYIPPGEDMAAINKKIVARHKVSDTPDAIEVRQLPEDLTVSEDHGILYLPHDYIVPGGRFNEMYAWDSYWIILGLLHDGQADIAKGIVENFIYEIKNYGGKCLNANRTYYLTRSQPPMLAAMVMAILPTLEEKEKKDFLTRAADAIAFEYENFWKKYRYDSERGLFHYGNKDQGTLGPCPEVLVGERDADGLSHYDKIAAYLRDLPPADALRLRFFDPATDGLSPDAFAGDRAMRESGFDTSMQMGYYGLETLDFNPVCLNTLLYQQCDYLAEIYQMLDKPCETRYFRNEAAELRANIQYYMWNGETGLFAHYNAYHNQSSAFVYLTSAYPLWAKIATQEQADAFHANLGLFETEFGMRATDQFTGCQWDAPFMWAPLVYFAVLGLKNYGYDAEALRIADKFIATVKRVNETTGANFEKYNAYTGGHRTEGIIEVGYSENVVGFGWTNGAAVRLQELLKASKVSAA